MIAFLACSAALGGYYLWQRSRYEARPPREAHGRALADAAALAVILACVWGANSFGVRWGVIAAEGSAGASVGALIGVLLAGGVRRGMLRVLRIDPGVTR